MADAGLQRQLDALTQMLDSPRTSLDRGERIRLLRVLERVQRGERATPTDLCLIPLCLNPKHGANLCRQHQKGTSR